MIRRRRWIPGALRFRWFRASMLAAVLMPVVTVPVSAGVLYREIFPHDRYLSSWPHDSFGNLAGSGSAHWYAHAGNSAQDWSGTVSIGDVSGSPTYAQPVNSNPQFPELDWGYFSLWGPSNVRAIYWTEEYQSLSSAQLTGASFMSKNGATADLMRVALRIDDDWFVSSQTLTQNTANVWENKTLSISGTTWRSLSFSPGSLGAPGSVVPLASGVVTGFGVYSDNKSSAQRIDSFTLMIPEPSMLLVFTLAAVPALLYRRRRTR